ncbi:MAG: carboxypeptidase regulatory-like domain-containing protein, partial [Blastocatellia bacterium]
MKTKQTVWRGDLFSTLLRNGFVIGMLVAVLLSGSAIALAQTATSATLRGTVKDPNGAVVPNATVTLTLTATQSERKTKSSSDGVYTLTSLAPGSYTLTVEASTFKKLVKTDVSLSPSEIKGIDVEMAIGAATESVTITASAAEEIKTETGERSNTIKASQIENLSIISRNSIELLRILPGVVAPDSSSYQISSYGDASGYSVNGQRGQNNNISIDGSSVIDIGCNCGSIISMNNDFIQEVTIKASNYSADSGKGGVGVIGIHKSGGKEFHGSFYNYTRHEALAANDRFRNYIKAQDPKSLAAEKPLGRFYYPGGTISGPIYLPKKVFGPLGGFNKEREKLFFFVGFEIQRQTFGAPPRISNVPTVAQRTGNFAGTTVKIPGGFANAGQNAPNSNLAPYINPIGKVLINLYPLPNSNIPGQNYISNTTQTQHR